MNRPERIESDTEARMLAHGRAAREAQRTLATATTAAKNRALIEAAKALRSRTAEIHASNAQDLEAARARGTSGAFLDRLALQPAEGEDFRNAAGF